MNNLSLQNRILIYTGRSGQPVIDVQTDGETVWLTQAQLVRLFDSSKANISKHIKNIFTEGELDPESTVRKFDWDDVVFEVDLLKSQEINLDYILEQIFENLRHCSV